MEQPFLIVGLGNPGQTYEHTRHNTGFLAIEHIRKYYQLPPFRNEKYSKSLCAKGIIQHTPVILAQPQTFMNNSGISIASLCKSANISPERIVIIHDEADLPLGSVRIGAGHGSAGHKGVESVIGRLGTKEFTRIRIGIQKKEPNNENTEAFVLADFSKEEKPLLRQALEIVSQSIPILLEQNSEKASDFCAKKLGETTSSSSRP